VPSRGPTPCADVGAIGVGQHQVEDHQVRRVERGLGQRLLGVVGGGNIVPALASVTSNARLIGRRSTTSVAEATRVSAVSSAAGRDDPIARSRERSIPNRPERRSAPISVMLGLSQGSS
jgi:hypothetical protein